MKNTRNWLVFLLCALLFVNTLGISAMAVENESPIVLNAAVSGSTVTVRILAAVPQTVADGKLVLTFDDEKLSDTKIEAGDAWTDTEHFAWSHSFQDDKAIVTFANAEAAAEGTLFTLTFQTDCDAVIAIDGSSYITGVTADLAQEITTCPSARFVDMQNMVPSIHEAVDYMVANGHMSGMSTTHFGPDLELNRAMMVTILHRIAGTPAVSGSHPFVDVPAGQFYTDAVVWAVENKITAGVDPTHFAPGKALTRQELVTFLHRFANYMHYDVTETTDLSAYTDADKVQNYAVDAFKWAVASGVIKGTSDTTLSPENTTTRAQICIMVTRLLKAQD